MGLYFENASLPGTKLAIWKTEESVSELCDLLGISAAELPSRAESRKKEWLAIRILIKILTGSEVLPWIEYDGEGKPTLKDAKHSISITHSKEYVGVLLSDTPSCGIDLEIIHPRILKIADRFLSEQEKKFMDPDRLLPSLYVTWGAKEVLYKLYGKGNILFRENLEVAPFVFQQQGTVAAQLTKDNYSELHTMHYMQLGNLMLTYAIG